MDLPPGLQNPFNSSDRDAANARFCFEHLQNQIATTPLTACVMPTFIQHKVKFAAEDSFLRQCKQTAVHTITDIKPNKFTGALSANVVYTAYAQGDHQDLIQQLLGAKAEKQFKRLERLLQSMKGVGVVQKTITNHKEQAKQMLTNDKTLQMLLTRVEYKSKLQPLLDECDLDPHRDAIVFNSQYTSKRNADELQEELTGITLNEHGQRKAGGGVVNLFGM